MNELLRGLKAAGRADAAQDPEPWRPCRADGLGPGRDLGLARSRGVAALRLLVEAGLLQRNQEGAWAWYTGRRPARRAGPRADPGRSAAAGRSAAIAPICSACRASPKAGPDGSRIISAAMPRTGKRSASSMPTKSVDKAVMALGAGRIDDLLDIGTGAGHMLLLLGERTERGVGVDRFGGDARPSHATSCSRPSSGIARCARPISTALPFDTGSFAAAILSMVLHFAEDPPPPPRPRASCGRAARARWSISPSTR